MAFTRDLYKTKLCTLYLQRGYCPRQSCSFAHGETELRKHPGRYSAENSRERVDRRRSPPSHRRPSPGRDERGRESHHDRRSPQHDRERSRSRSPPAMRKESRSLSAPRSSPPCKKKDSKKLRSDGDTHLSDVSGDVRGGEDTGADDADADNKTGSRRSSSPSVREAFTEQLLQVEADKKALLVEKVKLELSLQKKVQETTELSEKIAMLESDLADAQEDCKGLASKTKKLVKGYTRFFRAQEELKKAQAKLVRLVDEGVGENKGRVDPELEDTDINLISDVEPRRQIITSNLANHGLTVAAAMGSQAVRKDGKEDMFSNIEETASGETSQRKYTAALQEKRRASVKALQQNGFSENNIRTSDEEDANPTNGKLSGDDEIMREESREESFTPLVVKVRPSDSTPTPRATKEKAKVKEFYNRKIVKAMDDDGISTAEVHDVGGNDTNDEPLPD